MSKKSLGEQLNATAAELILLFLIFAIILLPVQLSQTFGSNIGGLAAIILGLLFIAILIAAGIDSWWSNKKKRNKPPECISPTVKDKCPSNFKAEKIITYKSNGVELKKCPYCKTAVRKKVKKCPSCDYNFK